MIWLVARLRHDFDAWDRATRLAFVLGVALLLIAIITAIIAPAEARLPLLIGAGLLLIVLEATVLWGNRGMVSAYTRAQRLYLEGDLEGARDLLEAVRPKANARVLTLLGNTYRQLGDLDQSEAVLSEAVDKAPKHYFSFYGFGRTLLSEGRYVEAAEMLRRALELGAPTVVQVDLAEVYYRLNQPNEALVALQNVDTNEPPRALMISYLRYRLDQAPPPAPELVSEGVAYWQALAERFRATPYGQALLLDVREMLNQGTQTHV